jgi:prolipoprotein diacylglyceryltransferase
MNDLALVAGRLLTSPRSAAHLGEVAQGNVTSHPFSGIKGGIVFWGALALVVIALLIVVAKLLPKPAQ